LVLEIFLKELPNQVPSLDWLFVLTLPLKVCVRVFGIVENWHGHRRLAAAILLRCGVHA